MAQEEFYKKRGSPFSSSAYSFIYYLCCCIWSSSILNAIKSIDANLALVWMGFKSETGSDLITDMYDYDSKDSYNIDARFWYKETLANGDLTVTNPYIGAVTGKPILSIAVPYYKGKMDKGAFAIDVMMDDIYKMMSEYTIGNSGYTVLFNSKGNLLYHPEVDIGILLEENPDYYCKCTIKKYRLGSSYSNTTK